jgi:hypothetical protein
MSSEISDAWGSRSELSGLKISNRPQFRQIEGSPARGSVSVSLVMQLVSVILYLQPGQVNGSIGVLTLCPRLGE